MFEYVLHVGSMVVRLHKVKIMVQATEKFRPSGEGEREREGKKELCDEN